MNSYYRKVNNCFNCDAQKMTFVNNLYEISCKECGKPVKIKKFGDTNIPIPDWCPRLKKRQYVITQEEFNELQEYRKMIFDDMK